LTGCYQTQMLARHDYIYVTGYEEADVMSAFVESEPDEYKTRQEVPALVSGVPG